MSLKIQTEIEIEIVHCASCGTAFGVLASYQVDRRRDHAVFYCPNGHNNFYPQKTEAENLKEELKRKEQELADKVIEKIEIQNELNTANSKLERVHKGTCPCCKRSFKDLSKHMQTKHPALFKQTA
jgi:hypothetical protein